MLTINLIAIGKRMPLWVEQAYQEYAKRLPKECQLNLIEIASQKRHKTADLEKIIQKESEQLLAASPKGAYTIALDRQGKTIDTLFLAKQCQQALEDNREISLLIGGPEGLAPECLYNVQTVWSLSALTLPHPLVRVLVAEQIYRAWSILTRHPYHR